MMKYGLCIISIVLVIIDAIIFLNFKKYISEHENELIKNHKSLLSKMIAMVIISILVGMIGIIIQFLP